MCRWQIQLSMICVAVVTLATAGTAIAGNDDGELTGIHVEVVADEGVPLLAHCSVQWQRAGEVARVVVRGGELAFADPEVSPQRSVGPRASRMTTAEWPAVEAGDEIVFEIDASVLSDGEMVDVIAERRRGIVRWQVVSRLLRVGDVLQVLPPAEYRITSVAGDGRAATAAVPETPTTAATSNRPWTEGILVESLAPKSLATVDVFLEDSVVKPISDGPGDCDDHTGVWTTNGLFYIDDAPPTATSDQITVHVTITHPVMSNLQVGFFYDPNYPGGSGKYLWKNQSGVNLDQDFTEDTYGSSIPGLGQSVNGYYNLAVRDCDAGNTGTLDYWSLLVQYEGTATIDLVADSLSLDEVLVAPGQTVSAVWQGHVAGSGNVGGPFNIGFFLSDDASFSVDDLLLAQITESAADAPPDTFGDPSPGRSLTIPPATADGDYHVLVVVDTGGAVDEVNEGNNLVGAQLAVADEVDLIADSVGAAATMVNAGDSLSVSYEGHAQGTGNVGGAFTIGLYLSGDTVIDTSDRVLAQRTGAWASNPGDVFSESAFPVTVPLDTPAGDYTLGLLVDSANVITETNENNNTAAFSFITVQTAPTVNLTADSCAVTPATVSPGGAATLSWRGRNIGDVDSGDFSWVVFLSDNPYLDHVSDRIIHLEDVTGGWAAGYDSGTVTTTVEIPDLVNAGAYYLGVALDAGSAVAESDEDDNSCAGTLTVEAAGANVTSWLVPAAASAPGYGDADWKSQIAVANPGIADRVANLYFVAKGSAWPGTLLSGPHTIPPTQSIFLDDPLLALSPVSGLVYVVLDNPGPVVSSRTFTLGSDGATFGQGIPAIALNDSVVHEEMVLPLVHSAPDVFHTNLGLVQTSTGSLLFTVRVYSPNGLLLGQKNYTLSGAYDQINNLFEDMGVGQLVVSGAWIRVSLAGGAPEYWTCYASVVDDVTHDPTYVAPVPYVEAVAAE